MQNFIKTFGDICEFYFLNGPRIAPDEPIKFFADRGMTSHRAWAGVKPNFKMFTIDDEGKRHFIVSLSQVNMRYAQETTLYIRNFLNSQDEPFDGFAGFSQGIATITSFFKTH